jgi:methionyl-tRNA formyltransferase
MRIFIITQNAPMYMAGFLDDFLDLADNTPHKVVGITSLSPIFNNSVFQEFKSRLDFYGLVDFLKMAFLITWNKLLSYVFYLSPSIGCYSVNNVIKKYGLKELKTTSINSNAFVEFIKEAKIDLILSIASSQILKQDLLNAPQKGSINYHTALLPKYRGRQPLFWALLNGEKEVGISVHEMDEKLDNGPIIVQKKINVNSRDSLHSIYLKTLKVGPELILEAIEKIARGDKDRIENDPDRATYNSFPTREDAKSFKKRGKRFF